MVSERCQLHAYCMISFIWRFRIGKGILSDRNQIISCLGQGFVRGFTGIHLGRWMDKDEWIKYPFPSGMMDTFYINWSVSYTGKNTSNFLYILLNVYFNKVDQKNKVKRAKKIYRRNFLTCWEKIKINSYILFPNLHRIRY